MHASVLDTRLLRHMQCNRVVCGPDFGEFLKVIEKQKERAAKFDDESDMSTWVGGAHIRSLLALILRFLCVRPHS